MRSTPKALLDLVDIFCSKLNISMMEARGIVNKLIKAMKEVERLDTCRNCGSYILFRDVSGRIVCDMCHQAHPGDT